MSDRALSLRPNRLKVLPHRLALAALQQDHLASCTYALLKILLFPERYVLYSIFKFHANNVGSTERFFSFTDTSDGISLVLEDDVVPFFPAEALQCTKQRWRAIKFDEGPLGFGKSTPCLKCSFLSLLPILFTAVCGLGVGSGSGGSVVITIDIESSIRQIVAYLLQYGVILILFFML